MEKVECTEKHKKYMSGLFRSGVKFYVYFTALYVYLIFIHGSPCFMSSVYDM